MAVRSNVYVYGRSLAGIAGSNPAGGEDAYLSLVSVVCYQVEVPMTGRSLVHSNPAKCVCVIEFDKVLQ